MKQLIYIFDKGANAIISSDEVAEIFNLITRKFFGYTFNPSSPANIQILNELTNEINNDPNTKVSIHFDTFIMYLSRIGLSISADDDTQLSKIMFLPYAIEGREIATTIASENAFKIMIDRGEKLPPKTDGSMTQYKLAITAFWELPIPDYLKNFEILLNRGFTGIIGYNFTGLNCILFNLPSDIQDDPRLMLNNSMFEEYNDDLMFKHGRLYQLNWEEVTVYHDGDDAGKGAGDFKFNSYFDEFNFVNNPASPSVDECWPLYPIDQVAYVRCVQDILKENDIFYSWVNDDWLLRNRMIINKEWHIDSFTYNLPFADLPDSYYQNETKNEFLFSVHCPYENNVINDIKIRLHVCEEDLGDNYCASDYFNFNPNISVAELPIYHTMGLHNDFEMEVLFTIKCLQYWVSNTRVDNGNNDGTCTLKTGNFIDNDLFEIFENYIEDIIGEEI